MSLMDKLKQNSTIKETAVLQDSKLFSEKEFYTTEIPALNVAFSGRIDGGFTSGLTTISGPSKHFKTSFALMMIKTYLNKHKDAICLFYDSEFGAPASYFASFGIDSSRVLHTPVTDIEELKFDCMKQLESIKRADRVIIAIDSIGNLASKKEVDDALEGKSVADMSRAKQLKSFFRMVTPHLNLKDIPMVTVNHTYQTQEIYSKAVVSGGCLVADTKLKMFDGSFKNIQDIQVNDMVETLMGPKSVTHTWNPETLENGNPECIEFEFEDGYKAVCSKNHPFLTTKGWVEASDLTAEHDIVCL